MWSQKTKGKNVPQFLNLGLVLPEGIELELNLEDEKERLQFQLYHYLCHRLSFENKCVLEVGCGTGGGSLFVKDYLKAKEVLGIDIVPSHINFAKKEIAKEGLTFKVGDACKIQEGTEVKDIVLNVESSHGYANFKAFVEGVYSCLKKEGHFVYADVWYNYELEQVERTFLQTGFKIVHKEDISKMVVKALDIDHKRKVKELIKTKLGQFAMGNFAFLKGSRNYDMLNSGDTIFIHYILSK